MLTIEQAYQGQERYRGNERVRAAISQTALIAFVAGTAAGKNFLMEQSGLPIVGTETTRAPRADDDPSHYTYSTQGDMLAAIENGDLVQYGVALPDDIYASCVHDYVLNQPNVADIWHDAVRSLYTKGFGDVRTVSVLTPKAQWMSQLGARLEGMRADSAARRLSEAQRSIRWSRVQYLSGAATHLLVINSVDNVDKNIETITDFAHGKPTERPSQGDVDETASEMLSAIDIMYKRLSKH